MKRSIILIFLFLITYRASAQVGMGKSLFLVDANYRQSGWFVGLGLTKMFAEDKNDYSFRYADLDEPIEYIGNVEAKGRFGLYAELGGFKILKHGFFNYFDYGLAYKQETGREELSAARFLGGPLLVDSIIGTGEYSQDHARAFFNLNKGIPLAQHLFLLQTIGLDAEYRVINKADYFHNFNELVVDAEGPFSATPPDESLAVHLHYKLGVGYKVNSGGYLILSAETPIQTLVPFDGVKSRQTVFNAEYRPVIFSLRYMWLRKRPDRTCSPSKAKQKNLKKKAKRNKKSGSSKDGQVR